MTALLRLGREFVFETLVSCGDDKRKWVLKGTQLHCRFSHF